MNAQVKNTRYEFNEAAKLFRLMYVNLSYNTIYQEVVKHVTNGGTLGFNPVTQWRADGRGKDSRKYKMLQHVFNTYDHEKIEESFKDLVARNKVNQRFRDGGGKGHGGENEGKSIEVEIDSDVSPDEDTHTPETSLHTQPNVEVDMAEVRRVARHEATQRVNELAQEIRNTHNIITIHDMRDDEMQVRELGLQHKMFETLLKFIRTRFPVWIPGPAGSGKTTAAMNVAKALNLPFHFNGAVDTEYKLLGFTDAGGHFHQTPFYLAFKYGGVYLFDEVDASNPNAMVAMNAALENGKCVFGNGECVEIHADFYVIAAANTYGGGATHEYVGRNKLDAATVDRFIMLEWDYDEALERAVAHMQNPNSESVVDDWVTYVQRVRLIVKNTSGIKHVVSPRASLRGARMLCNGINRESVIAATVRKGLSSDQWLTVSRSV